MKKVANRERGYWPLLCYFVLFILFLYGPMFAIFTLSFQGPDGGLTFPMNDVSLHWFADLFETQRVGDFKSSFLRSITLASLVMVITVVVSLLAGLAFRRDFRGSGLVFYMTIASLIVPSILLTLGIGLSFDQLGFESMWYTSGLGAHLSWTLPFGLLIMFAVFNRFNKAYEEAARDMGATPFQVVRMVIIPIIAPSLVGVGLFGFTLSFDEFARSLLAMGVKNSLPLELFGMTTTVTTPTLYALGTLTTLVSFAIIGLSFLAMHILQRRHLRQQGV
jgi:putative spermidine/putrescine transport system permease protein